MTLDEVREILEKAAWTRETPLVTLFDELVEQHDRPEVVTHYDGVEHQLTNKVTRAFAGLTQPSVASGQIVALVLSLRQTCKLPLYEVSDERGDTFA